MKKTIVLSIAAVFLISSSAIAEQFCMPSELLNQKLKQFGEEKVLTMDNIIPLTNEYTGFTITGKIDIYTNPKNGKWTMFMRRPDDVSCFLRNGDKFTAVRDIPKSILLDSAEEEKSPIWEHKKQE